MRRNRIAMVMLAAGFAVGVAEAQSDPYGPPGNPGPGPQGQYGQQGQGYDPGRYEDDWREGDDWYERQSNDDYDRNGYDGSGSYDGYGGYDDYSGRDNRYQPPSVEVGFFYNELSPYGEWVRHPYYGWVWFPRNVHAGWRPYSVGRWVMSDYGWTWVSYERFGWATYHYGRWAWDRYVGWLWVPGTDWGPAWVAWQQGNGYIGWAPLPPAVGFDVRVGIQLGGFNLSFGIAPRNYAFVEERRFLDNRIGGYIVPEARNVTIIHNTTNITNYTVVDNRVINRGVPVERVERVTGRRAQRMRVANASAPTTNVIEKDVVRIYRPAETKLESVKVAKRNNAGLRQVAKPEKAPRAQAPDTAPANRPPTASSERKQNSDKVPIAVAPRVQTAPQKVNEKQFAREQQELKANQQKQQQAVEQIQRREKAQVEQKSKGRSDGKGAATAETQGAAKEYKGQPNPNNKAQAAPKADAQEIQKRHAAERAEQQLLREREAAQLKNRQQIQRQAAEASAVKAKGQGKAPQAATEEAKPPKGGKGKQGKEQTEEEKQKEKKAKGQKQTSSNDGQKPPQSF